MTGISKSMLSVGLAMVLLTTSAAGSEVFYQNMGENQCLNLKGEMETCGYLQFCSESSIHRGCRNCSDIDYETWCDKDLGAFRKKYAQCEILCERKKLEKTEEELKATGSALRKSDQEKEQRGQEILQLRDSLANERAEKEEVSAMEKMFMWTAVALGVTNALTLGFLICVCVRNRGLKKEARDTRRRNVTETQGTASHNGDKSWWDRVRSCCLPRKKKRQGLQPLTPEHRENDPENQETTFTTTYVPTATFPASDYKPPDSGHASSVPSSSSSSLKDRVAPSGARTAHHPKDPEDFMQSFPRCAGDGGGDGTSNGEASA